jgi:hypothetical protein
MLTEMEAARVRRLVLDRGEPEVVKMLMVSRSTLPRLIARLPMQRGTVALVRQRLKERANGRVDR